LINFKYKLSSVSNMRKASPESKLRSRTLPEQKRGAKTIVVDYRMWGAMLDAYHKLKKKPWTIAELETTLQKPVAQAVQNFRKR